MRKCEEAVSPECYAEASVRCEACGKWFCRAHFILHPGHRETAVIDKAIANLDNNPLQQRVKELEAQNGVLLGRAESAESQVAQLQERLNLGKLV